MKIFLKILFAISIFLYILGLISVASSWLIGIAYFIYNAIKSDLGFWIILGKSLFTFISLVIIGFTMIIISKILINKIEKKLTDIKNNIKEGEIIHE